MKKLLLILVFGITLLFGKVDINHASKEELQSLKGIGKTTAERIIQHRKVSCFTSLEEIKKVKGIGEGKFKKIEEMLELTPCK